MKSKSQPSQQNALQAKPNGQAKAYALEDEQMANAANAENSENLMAVEDFEQEAKAVLDSQGLTKVSEVHFQAKLQYLIDLTYEPIPDVKDSLFALLADNAPGFTAGQLKNGVTWMMEKVAKEAKQILASREDIDLPTFAPVDFLDDDIISAFALDDYDADPNVNYKAQDVAPGFLQKPFSYDGTLCNAPLFYLANCGVLINNRCISTKLYCNNRIYTRTHHVFSHLPNSFRHGDPNVKGLYAMFNGQLDIQKLSQAGINVQILYYVWYIATNLVKHGAIMPKLIVDYGDRLRCLWIPAILSKPIRDLVTKVGLFVQGYEYLFILRKDRSVALDPLFLGQLMLSCFIQSFVSFTFCHLSPAQIYEHNEYKMLFGGFNLPVGCKNPQMNALRLRLETWLAPLSMNQLSFTPVLRFYDLDDPDVISNARFMVLSEEILKGTKSAKNAQVEALKSFAKQDLSWMDSAQSNSVFSKAEKGQESHQLYLNSSEQIKSRLRNYISRKDAGRGDVASSAFDNHTSGKKVSFHYLPYNGSSGFDPRFSSKIGSTNSYQSQDDELDFQGFELDDVPQEIAPARRSDGSLFNLSLESVLENFENTKGVGVELGFSDLGSEISAKLSKKGLLDDSEFVPLSLILQEDCCEPVRYECVRTASRLGAIANILNELFKAPNNICIVPLHQLYETLQIATHGLSLLGVRLLLPNSLKSMLKPVSRVKLSFKGDNRESNSVTDNSSLGLEDFARLLDFDWQLAIGDRKISADEFKVLLANSGRVVRFHEQFVYADPTALLSIKNSLQRESQIKSSHMALLDAALTGRLEEFEVILSQNVKEALAQLTSPTAVALPQGLQAVLRPYQKRGYDWLMHNLRVKIGSVLADDMGLGKTLQVIAALLKLKEEGKLNRNNQALIVVPTSLITNWIREIHNFAPALTVGTYHSISTDLGSIDTDVILTSYGTARARSAVFNKRTFLLLVIDEAQAIKNRTTAVHKAVNSIKADYFIAMSGTPVENHLFDYYSILDFANRGVFGTSESFKRRFAIPIERDHDMQQVQRFKDLTSPFILRRLKTDKNIISDLPDKITSDQYCLLTPNQSALYQTVVQEAMERLDNMDQAKDRSSLVLSLIQKLKAICNSPAQYLGSSAHYLPEDSGKVERLLELVDEIMQTDNKALIFTQSVIMGNYLVEILKKHTGHAPQFLHGSLNIKSRMDMVDNFQNKPSERFLILSLHVGGTGLNLTAANIVIHFDLWWNSAVENQATDRAFRIGQSKNVQVYRFICAHTFEEHINDMINKKRDLAEMTVANGETWIGDLSNRQLQELFALNDSDDNDSK